MKRRRNSEQIENTLLALLLKPGPHRTGTLSVAANLGKAGAAKYLRALVERKQVVHVGKYEWSLASDLNRGKSPPTTTAPSGLLEQANRHNRTLRALLDEQREMLLSHIEKAKIQLELVDSMIAKL